MFSANVHHLKKHFSTNEDWLSFMFLQYFITFICNSLVWIDHTDIRGLSNLHCIKSYEHHIK